MDSAKCRIEEMCRSTSCLFINPSGVELKPGETTTLKPGVASVDRVERILLETIFIKKRRVDCKERRRSSIATLKEACFNPWYQSPFKLGLFPRARDLS
jgi:hypothetical protein